VRLGSYVEPYVQALVGYDSLNLRIGVLNQDVGQVAATGLLGLCLVFPTQPRDASSPAFLVDFGVGYGFRPKARFDALAPEPPDEDAEEPVPSVPLPVGDLPLSGVAYRLQLGLRL
jgi:hypothetical protein